MTGNTGNQFADEKFLEKVGGGDGADAECGAFEGQGHAVALVGRVVERGDCAGRDIAADIRIIRLPAAIVPFANDGVGEGVENSGAFAAGALVEIARILFQERRKDGATDKSAGDKIGVSGSIALGVPLDALSIAAEIVLRLLNAGYDAIQSETDGIKGCLPGQLEFLARGQRDGVVDVADIKIGNEAQDALLLLIPDLIFGDFRGGGDYAQFGGDGGDHQGERWNGEVLSGV